MSNSLQRNCALLQDKTRHKVQKHAKQKFNIFKFLLSYRFQLKKVCNKNRHNMINFVAPFSFLFGSFIDQQVNVSQTFEKDHTRISYRKKKR